MVARSQNGWVARSNTELLTRCTAQLTGGTLLHFWAANPDVGVVFTDYIQNFDTLIERVAGPVLDDWSWADRPIRESTVTSNHASATAIDLNALKHPRKAHDTYSPEDRKKLRTLVASYGGVLRHGEFYAGTIDGMHCEIDAGPTAVKQLADRIRARNAPTPQPPIEADMTTLDPSDVEKIATRVWTTKPATVGQETGGSLHEIDLRTAADNLRDRAKDGVAAALNDPAHPLSVRLAEQDDKLDQILTLLKPE